MCSLPSDGWPTEPLCASHSALSIDGEAVALGAGVVLVDDRPPPVDHLLLDLDRARARRRGRPAAGCDRSYAAARLGGSFSMRTNIVGTHWPWVTRCARSAPAPRSASKRSITTTVPPSAARRCDQPQRRGVVERRRREVDACRRRAEERLAAVVASSARRSTGWPVSGALDALGPAGGAGRVEHESPSARRRSASAGIGGERVLVASRSRRPRRRRISRARAAGVERRRARPTACQRRARRRAPAPRSRRRCRRPRPPVRWQLTGGEVEPGALRRPHHLEERGPVLHEDRDVVAGAQAGGAQQLAPAGWTARRARRRSARGAGAGHDDGRLVGLGGRVDARVHRVPCGCGRRC